MRLPNSAHTSRHWRVDELTPDFRLEDVWELPGVGGPDDFPRLVRVIAALDPSHSSSFAVRTLFTIRWQLGELFGWDDTDAGVGARVPSLRDRLPADLRDATSGPDFDALPFTSLYLIDDEWAAEIANRTMHGVMHIGLVPDETGSFRAQLAVLVKPNSLFGNVYMAAIRPFRHLIVYPSMLREGGRTLTGGDSLDILARPPKVTLPPGQHAVDGFPRFGTHLARPSPAVPFDPVIEISGAVAKSFALPLAELATLPRRELTADFHCVAGWSATNLHWEGVAFETFYRMIIEPSVQPDTSVTHVVFGGLDGYRSVVAIDDALATDVLIAERLDGRPLDSDHGAPARLVSPKQYGFVSTKHLCRIELHTAEPTENYSHLPALSRVALRSPLIKPHARARVWKEERSRYFPAWAVRRVYRLLIPPIAFLCARGDRRRGSPPPPPGRGV
jgi:DMSO/TMAO reductase YedYZ molybdopterin-dependent catalytic subunit